MYNRSYLQENWSEDNQKQAKELVFFSLDVRTLGPKNRCSVAWTLGRSVDVELESPAEIRVVLEVIVAAELPAPGSSDDSYVWARSRCFSSLNSE